MKIRAFSFRRPEPHRRASRAELLSALLSALPITLVVALGLSVGGPVTAQHPPRPGVGCVYDSTSSLNDDIKSLIDHICEQVNQQSTGEIFVAIIPTTDGQNHRQFATDLFNAWQIGDPQENNGILIFAAMQDRKAEIILGDGIDGPAEETKAQAVMDEVMMPQFKRGQPGRGVLGAVRACAERYFDLSLAAQTPRTAQSRPRPPSTQQVRRPEPAQPQRPSSLPIFLLVGGGFLSAGGVLGVRSWARKSPRVCDRCNRKMVLLDEVTDNEHLTSGEQAEEELGSVDYDVWLCLHCDHALKLRYGRFFTGYKKCPRCEAKTTSASTVTISHATEYSTGLEEITETCYHCDFERISEHVTPRLPDDDDDSSSSFSGGSSSFSGGSSSSGGGGSSSGGGASGSW